MKNPTATAAVAVLIATIIGFFAGRVTKVCKEPSPHPTIDSLSAANDSLRVRDAILSLQYAATKDSLDRLLSTPKKPIKDQVNEAAHAFSVAGIDSTANYLLSEPRE